MILIKLKTKSLPIAVGYNITLMNIDNSLNQDTTIKINAFKVKKRQAVFVSGVNYNKV